MLYVTGVEYGDYTMNHVQGCAHACKYPCYAYMLKKRFGKISSYEEWKKPFLVSNTLDILDDEIPRLKDKIKSVHLCFTTDPFMYGYPEIEDMSIRCIKKLNAAGIKCTILTKGLLPEKLSSLSTDNIYGITLISQDEEHRKYFEPGASSYSERLDSLLKLHSKGCKTWVSIEPYPTPNIVEQDIKKILQAVSFVDTIIFGRTNYSKEVSSFKEHKKFYNSCANEVILFCKKNNIKYHIKEKTITT